MKKATKIALITGIALCIFGGILYGAGRAAGGVEKLNDSKTTKLKNSGRETVVLDREKLGEIQSIEGNIADVDLEIKPSEDDSCYLSYNVETRKGKNPVTYSVKDGTLKLKEDEGYDNSFYVKVDLSFLTGLAVEEHIEDDTNLIIIYLPEDKLLEDCNISLGDGDMRLEGLHSKNLNLKSESGDVDFDHVELKNAAITLQDGDLRTKELVMTGEVQIQSETGDVDIGLNREKSGRLAINARTESGDITASSFWEGDLYDDDYDDTAKYERSVKTSSGTLNIKSGDGDITIK